MLALRLYQVLRFFLYPLARGSVFLSASLKRRYILEKKYNIKKEGWAGDYAFHVSSEGELEQVYSLVEHFLEKKKNIEMIFSSESVLKNLQRLQGENPENIKLLAMPFLTYMPWTKSSLNSLVSAPVFFMCRYDFFPELLELSITRKLVFLSTISKYLKTSFIKGFWPMIFFKKSYYIVPNSREDEKSFQKVFPSKTLSSFDFRIPRVLSRLSNKEKSYEEKGIQIKSLQKKIRQSSQAIILGSFWDQDTEYIQSALWKNPEVFFLILPHRLDERSVTQLKKKLESLDLWGQNVEIELTRGVLCELYSEFSYAFVGGGYRGSPGVHSLLEPYLAGCEKIFCGPEVGRSTEYKFVIEGEPGKIKILSEEDSLKLADLKEGSDKASRGRISLTKDYRQLVAELEKL